MTTTKRAIVVGGGVAGLCAALDLAGLQIGVDLVEKEPVLGGHAARLSCKATDRCVQCGACLVAFFQCVGSRDAAIVHLWGSRFCCASAWRSAAWIKTNHPEIDITVFYIDLQTTGIGPQGMPGRINDPIRMVRAIPGDVSASEDGRLQITYWDPETRCGAQTEVDMIVLSAGMQPAEGSADIGRLLGQVTAPWESGDCAAVAGPVTGVFWAGTAAGPRTIAETVASAGAAAWQVVRYLGIGG